MYIHTHIFFLVLKSILVPFTPLHWDNLPYGNVKLTVRLGPTLSLSENGAKMALFRVEQPKGKSCQSLDYS